MKKIPSEEEKEHSENEAEGERGENQQNRPEETEKECAKFGVKESGAGAVEIQGIGETMPQEQQLHEEHDEKERRKTSEKGEKENNFDRRKNLKNCISNTVKNGNF